jgi:hypothetical protein
MVKNAESLEKQGAPRMKKAANVTKLKFIEIFSCLGLAI